MMRKQGRIKEGREDGEGCILVHSRGSRAKANNEEGYTNARWFS